MKPILSLLTILFLAISCHQPVERDNFKQEILNTEKAFEQMTRDKGIAEAFYYFADESAVIKRENDTLIKGKENIKNYYSKKDLSRATVNWIPDFVDVSECGTLGYTYGNYVWKIANDKGDTTEYRGIFHTVWKKQKDTTWKYVWD